MDSSTGTTVSPAGPVDRGYATEDERAQALRRVNHASRVRLGWLWEWAKVFQIAFLLFLVLKTFLLEAYKIPSGSMEHTLLVGDFLLVNKLVYGAEVPFTGRRLPRLRAPQRGDVVVFQWPSDPSKNFVKRLVGLPGDTLMMRDGQLFVDGRQQREVYVTHTEPDVDPTFEEFRWQRDYLVRSAVAAPAGLASLDGAGPVPRTSRDPGEHPSRNNWGPLIVPRDSYFMLGDNRDNSLDSRYWGFVPDSLVRGRPLLVYYSYAPDSADRLAWVRDIRWSRLGERVR
jgi:signal peptidase I